MQWVPQAEKSSQQISERHLRRRTSALKKVGEMDRHIVQLLRWESQEERKKFITEALGSELTLEITRGGGTLYERRCGAILVSSEQIKKVKIKSYFWLCNLHATLAWNSIHIVFSSLQMV